MEDRNLKVVISTIKMPFIFILYFFYMFLSLFMPSKVLKKIINIEMIEKEVNFIFNDRVLLKLIALILTIITFIYFY